jgi:hypothetical protein
VDDDQQCLPISVYNLSQGSGVKIGDSVSIPEPYLQTIKVNHKDVVSVHGLESVSQICIGNGCQQQNLI